MKRIGERKRGLILISALLLLAFGIAACGGGSSNGESAPEIELAPEIKGTLYTGEEFQLSSLRGNPVVINFWFPSCPPCRAEMPDLEEVWQQYRGQGVEFIGIQLLGLDTEEDGKRFVQEIGVTYSIVADRDGSITRAYKVAGFPSTYVIDSEGRIAREWTGFLDRDILEDMLSKVL